MTINSTFDSVHTTQLKGRFLSQSISPDDALNVEYTGQGRPLFNLAFKTAFLTLITLGVYRFWARTRLRKYFWSAVAPGGHSFEYDGRGLEKFLGFLIAVVVLAFYLGIIQVLLTFAGMSLFATVNPDGAGSGSRWSLPHGPIRCAG